MQQTTIAIGDYKYNGKLVNYFIGNYRIPLEAKVRCKSEGKCKKTESLLFMQLISFWFPIVIRYWVFAQAILTNFWAPLISLYLSLFPPITLNYLLAVAIKLILTELLYSSIVLLIWPNALHIACHACFEEFFTFI